LAAVSQGTGDVVRGTQARRGQPDPPAADAAAAGLLRAEDISMAFTVRKGRADERIEVLEKVSLDVQDGEFCCVIGPSGCGKSTLLRILDGLIRPTSGQVVIRGTVCTSPRADVGVVFQSFNLFPWRTVAQNVELGLEERGIGRAERHERAGRWLDRVGLTGFEHFYPGQLSGGMQQRVGLARALAIEPDILLMDEPFGSLDAQTRLLLQAELLRLWALDRKTVVFVTHDVEEALFLADRVVILSPRPGSVVGSVKVPFDRPRGDRLRADPAFAQLREELWEGLKAGITVPQPEDPAPEPDGAGP
jgi:ABC-type nitrate/sulfonate/bicarbonate transport system ATPase subunit